MLQKFAKSEPSDLKKSADATEQQTKVFILFSQVRTTVHEIRERFFYVHFIFVDKSVKSRHSISGDASQRE